MEEYKNKVTIDITDEGKILIFSCPHCLEEVIVFENEINCTIFRHAVYKENMQQINPHTPKEDCDKLVNEDKVFGCAKPFKIIKENNIYDVEICDYI